MRRFQRELQSVYGSLSSPKDSLPGNLNERQTELVATLLDEDHFRTYPPSTEYQKAFWRHVILSIENSGNVSESLKSPSDSMVSQCDRHRSGGGAELI
jgi:hypothetical protein